MNIIQLWYKTPMEQLLHTTLSHIRIKPPLDVDVLGVLEFQIPCLRPETTALCPKSLLTNHDGHGQKLGRPGRH